MAASLNDVVTASSGLEIGTLISGSATGLAAFLGKALDETFVNSALLPVDASLNANLDVRRYLEKRPQAFYQTVAAHLSADVAMLGADGLTAGTFNMEYVEAGPTPFTLVVTAGNAGTGADPMGPDNYGTATFDSAAGTVTGLTAPANINGKADALVSTYDASGFIFPASTHVGIDFTAPVGKLSGQLSTLGSADYSYIDLLVSTHGHDLVNADQEFSDYLSLFLPSDTAIDAIDANGDIVQFLSWNRDVTRIVLSNHIVNSTIGYFSEDVANVGGSSANSITTIGGKTLDFPIDNTLLAVQLDGAAAAAPATVGAANIFTTNGVIHGLDQGLLVNQAELDLVTGAIAKNLTETLDPTEFEALLGLVGLVPTIADQIDKTTSIQTLLAPNKDAFGALAQNQIDYLESAEGQEDLIKVLSAHLLTSPYFPDDPSATSPNNFRGFDALCDGYTCNNGTVTLSMPMYGKYGLTYSIDQVIIPSDTNIPAPTTPTSTTTPTETDSDSSSSDSGASVVGVSGILAAGCALALALL